MGTWAFNIFINNLEKRTNNDMTEVADDAKLFMAGITTRTRADCEDWQKDLLRLNDWTIKWQMNFNVNK